MGLRYRVGQFWHLLTAPPLTAEVQRDIQEQLTAAEYELFGRYTHGDQWHAYQVMCLLRQAGYTHRALLTAALLHDVGKTRSRFTPIARSIVSLGGKLFPRVAERWGRVRWEEAGWWQRPFVIDARHPEWSAEMAAAVGSSPAAVALMRRHQKTVTEIQGEEDQLLAYLQWADDQN